jgi:protein N-terminal methyltransferase
VDLVENCKKFVETAKSSLDQNRVRIFCQGMQEFKPEKNTYDIIWIQWAIGHLTDGNGKVYVV